MLWPANPADGSSSDDGSASVTSCPEGVLNLSFNGLKEREPEKANAVTISGEPINESVSALPSLRARKFLLYDVMIVFLSPFLISVRFHWPIHGPHALANTVAPASVRAFI